MRKVNVKHLENKAIIQYAKPKKKYSVDFANKEQVDPESINGVYAVLGQHGQPLTVFWDKVSKDLPVDCRWVVYGRPVLVNPKSGIIFGAKLSSYNYALRLPEVVRNIAMQKGGFLTDVLSDGKAIDVSQIGNDWVMFKSYANDHARWCLDAYNYVNNL